MNIKNAKKVVYKQLGGNKIMRDIFEDENEKERASQIEDALKGLTIHEAQSLLEKVSDALINHVVL